MPRIFIIIGKSATGKDTIYKSLLEAEDLQLNKIVMYTTRPIRKGEAEGVEYNFTDEDYLYKLKEANKIIEHRSYNTIHGIWHYFTANDGQINIDKHDYLMIGTLEAYSQIKEYFGNDRVIPIYIEVEDGLRLMRAIMREREQENPRYTEACRRFIADAEDFSEEKLRQNGIITRYDNTDFESCLAHIKADIKNFTVNNSNIMLY